MLLRHALAKPNARSSHRIPYAAGRCNRGPLLIAGGAIVGFVPSGAPFPSVVFAATATNIIRQYCS
jgi:hypothetical protein